MSLDQPINWDLIERLWTRPHPLLKNDPAVHARLPEGVGEVMQQALAAHHLLDVAGVPATHHKKQPDSTDLDARVYRLLLAYLQQRDRMAMLARWHHRQRFRGTDGPDCNECGQSWPCDTYLLATNAYEEPG